MISKGKTANSKTLQARLNGQLRRLFKTDYQMLRLAGLTRNQAWRICANRYLH